MANIAIFGGTGTVGNHVAKALQTLGHSVTCISRTPHLGLSNHQVVDIHNKQQTAAVCSQHDIVVNAAGPAHIIQSRVAEIAIAKGVPYVDVAGESEVFEELRRYHLNSKTPCILGAGFVPGFASLLAYIAQQKLGIISELKVYIGGVEVFTPTSAQDFLASIGAKDAMVGCGIVKGIVTRILPEDKIHPHLDAPCFSALPYLSAEHQRVARELKIDNYQSFNLIANKKILLFKQKNNDTTIQTLISDSQALAQKYGTQQYCLINAKGWVSKQPVCLNLYSRCPDGYRLTAWISAIVAHQLARGIGKNVGLCWLSDVIDIDDCLLHCMQAEVFEKWQLSVMPDLDTILEEGEL